MAGRVIPDLRTGYRFVANGEIKMPGTIEGDTTQRGHIQIIEDHDIKFVNGGKISNVSTVNGINLSNWKSDYDSKIDQNVKFDSSPQFANLQVASVVCPNYPGDGTGLFNTVDIKAFKADYDLKVNQNVKTSSTPSFAGLTVGTVGYPTARSTTGYVLTQGEDGDVHFEQPNTTLPGRITLASGTAGEPAYSWSIDDSSGIYYDNGTAISRGGIKRVWLDNSGFNVDDPVDFKQDLTASYLTVNNNATVSGTATVGTLTVNNDAGITGTTTTGTLTVNNNAGITGTTTTGGLTVGSATFSTSGTAPVYGCRGFAVFDGTAASDVKITGNYNRAGDQLTFAITAGTDPVFIVGNRVYLNFTSGAATSGEFTITTVFPGSPNNYRITHTSSGTTSGTFEIRLRAVKSSGNVNSVVSILSTGNHLVNFATTVPTNFSISGMCENGLVRLVASVGLESTKFVRVLSVNTGGTAIDSATVSVSVIA
jgi:hypothetical protein